MKTLAGFTRPLAVATAVALAAGLAASPASARTGGMGHVGASGWHGGPGHFRGGHWGYRSYWPGAFWGGVGLGLGIGAVGYYGGYYGGYYAPYYGGAYYYDAPVVVAPVYRNDDAGYGARSGQPVPTSTPDPIFYPKNGQSAEATESDRRECNRWATTQRGAMADASIFQRATLACMEAHGYTSR